MTEHHDRDTVVVRDGGSSTGLILGIIAVIIVLAGAWYFLHGPGREHVDLEPDRHQCRCHASERGTGRLLSQLRP